MMDHAKAIQTLAVERYLLKEMVEPELSEFEEHVFECEECTFDISVGQVFAAVVFITDEVEIEVDPNKVN